MDITRREALRRVMIGGAALATGMGQYVDLYGLERVQRFMPWKSMVDNGVPLSFGSDWSAAPVNPLPGLFMAKYRLTLMGEPWGANDDSLDMGQAVRAYTMGSAIDLKMEDDIGSLEIGFEPTPGPSTPRDWRPLVPSEMKTRRT